MLGTAENPDEAQRTPTSTEEGNISNLRLDTFTYPMTDVIGFFCYTVGKEWFMEKKEFVIGHIPAVEYGEKSEKVCLYLHGQGGSKRESERFAWIACENGYQVIAVDLPEHGGRKDSACFVPWDVEAELHEVLAYMKKRWNHISIRAVSIGVWFSLCAFEDERFETCLYSSPLLNMSRMIHDLMYWHGVDEKILQEKQEITCEDGTVLSWRYFMYAREHGIHALSDNTHILYPECDEMIPRETVERFVNENGCTLDVVEHAKHYMHTEKEIEMMEKWERKYL